MPLLWSTILIINNYLVKHLGSTTSKTEAGLLMPHGRLLVFATLGLWCHVSSLLRSNVWKMETAEGGLVNPHGWRFHTVLPSNPTSAHNPYNPPPDSIKEFKIKNEKIYLSDSWIGKLFVLIFELAPESFFAQIKPISYLNLPSSAYIYASHQWQIYRHSSTSSLLEIKQQDTDLYCSPTWKSLPYMWVVELG